MHGAADWEIRGSSPGGCWLTLGYTQEGLAQPKLLRVNADIHHTEYPKRGDVVPLPDQGHLPDVSTSKFI